MKHKIVAIIFNLLSAISSPAEEIPQALVVETPATWQTKYKGKNSLQFYTLTRKDGDPALLMFSRWPAPGNVNQIPKMVKELADGFILQAEKDEDIKLESTEYEIEKINGKTFSGNFVQFKIIEGAFIQTMFLIGDDQGIWSGQFTGTEERWKEALEILTTLKKKD